MPYDAYDDEDDDELLDEYPDEDADADDYGGYGDDSEPTVPCPHCRREIHEDAQRCPYCERYISQEDAPSQQKPWIVVTGVILCLLIVLGWLVM